MTSQVRPSAHVSTGSTGPDRRSTSRRAVAARRIAASVTLLDLPSRMLCTRASSRRPMRRVGVPSRWRPADRAAFQRVLDARDQRCRGSPSRRRRGVRRPLRRGRVATVGAVDELDDPALDALRVVALGFRSHCLGSPQAILHLGRLVFEARPDRPARPPGPSSRPHRRWVLAAMGQAARCSAEWS